MAENSNPNQIKNQQFENELKLLTPQIEIQKEPESVKYYAKDWTTYFDIKASGVLFPKSCEEVRAIVLAARKFKIALVPSGGRTGLSGAACAISHEWIVSFEKMNQILEFNSIDQTVKIQAGVITESLQKFAEEKNLYYPVDFAARGSSQMGGNIATNAGGIKVVHYGLTRDWIVGLKVVTGAGEILELNNGLVKNATGYDLRHLFIGSEGTLGFICEATVKLTSPPPPLQVLVLGLSSLDNVMKVFSEFKTKTNLIAYEMFSNQALEKVVASTGLAKPFETACDHYVVVEVENPNSETEEKILGIFESCLENGWVIDGALAQTPAQAKNFWRLREDISESLAKFSPYKNDISVRISAVPNFIKQLDQVLTKAYPTWEVIWFGHIGDGNLHINILRPEGMAKEAFVAECRKVDQLIFHEIKEVAGSISAEHGVGLTKKPFLNYTRSEAEISLFKSIKNAFDPDGIINPGKVF